MRPVFKTYGVFAELRHASFESGAVFLQQPFFGNRTGGHRGRGQARGRTPAAARVTHAVLLQIRVISVAGPEGLQNVAVVLAALVGVLNQERDRRAGGHALVNAAQDLHLVRFLALGDVPTGAGTTPVQVVLYVGLAQSHAGRAAVDDAADGRAVGFTEVGDCK